MTSQALPAAGEAVVLAIDVGTSSVRTLVCDQSGQDYASTETQLTYRLHTTSDGGAEVDANALLGLLSTSIDETLAKVAAAPPKFVAVGVTSFWHSLVGVDAVGDPITPIYLWADSRSDATIALLGAQLDRHALWQQTGCRLHSSYWPAKLFWLRLAQPETFAAVRRWVSFTEFASARLSNDPNPGISISMASGTGLLDVHALDWTQPLLDLLAIDRDLLPPLIDVDAFSVLSPKCAARWPALAAVPWIPALGDGACANVGSGAVGPNRLALTLGTSGAMRVILPAPAGRQWAVPDGLWAYRLDRKQAVLGGALSNGGNLRRWLAELTGLSQDETACAVRSVGPDEHGLTVLPFVAGERSPGWHADATGVVAGLTMATTAADLARAALEAVAYRFARIYEALLPVTAPDHQIIANGGAIVSSPEWSQIIASTLGHSIICLPPGDEATARGAALVALRTVGMLDELEDAPDPAANGSICQPIPDEYPRYAAGQARQTALEATLFPPAN